MRQKKVRCDQNFEKCQISRLFQTQSSGSARSRSGNHFVSGPSSGSANTNCCNTVSSSNEVLSSFVIYAQMKHNSSMNMAMTIKGLGTDKADLLEGNKMADEGKSLDELIEEAEALLELEKPRKRKKGESEFEFYRDSLTGHRTTKHKHRPRCRRPTSQSTATCTSNSLEGLILKYKVKKEV